MEATISDSEYRTRPLPKINRLPKPRHWRCQRRRRRSAGRAIRSWRRDPTKRELFPMKHSCGLLVASPPKKTPSNTLVNVSAQLGCSGAPLRFRSQSDVRSLRSPRTVPSRSAKPPHTDTAARTTPLNDERIDGSDVSTAGHPTATESAGVSPVPAASSLDASLAQRPGQRNQVGR